MSGMLSRPELKQILGALIFGANRPLSIKELRNCLSEVAEADSDAAVFGDVMPKQLEDAIEELRQDLARTHAGFTVQEVAGGYRLQSDAACGLWLKHLLKTKPQRLSQPALETMAIIAYRQPISKADIESIRGVSVAHIIKGLMEMQLVRIAGRSELPGRPFLYGTTHLFLEHFGLKNINQLDQMAPRVLSKRVRADDHAETLLAEDEEAARRELEDDPRQVVMAFEDHTDAGGHDAPAADEVEDDGAGGSEQANEMNSENASGDGTDD